MAFSTGRTLVGAVDQGTTNTRFLIFDSQTAELITYHQQEIHQHHPKAGWVEQDPREILKSVRDCIQMAVSNLKALNMDSRDIKAIGISNQRDTTIVWDKKTGKPLHNAIVWLDMRATETAQMLIKNFAKGNKDFLRSRCGLPISNYFSAVKLTWLLNNKKVVRNAMLDGDCLFGNVDTWLVWNLTGGRHGGRHVTDVTNASRTMLMHINNLEWDFDLCRFFGIPLDILPEVRSSSEIYGSIVEGILKGVPISGIVGNQQAALLGQACFTRGQAKITYGTGCFFLTNTGTEALRSDHGLLTTVAFKLGSSEPAYYALEGSVAVAGGAIQWLQHNLGILKDVSDVETLAESVKDTHGCYFVPAFSGLSCPYWLPDARGIMSACSSIICGLSAFTTKAHIARAALEAVCFQTRDLLEALENDCDICLSTLWVDGGMTRNKLLMQMLADLCGLTVVCPSMPEMTALGAAMAAGSAEGIGVWDLDELAPITTEKYHPSMKDCERDRKFRWWKVAVQKANSWSCEQPEVEDHFAYFLKSTPAGLFALASIGILMLAEFVRTK